VLADAVVQLALVGGTRIPSARSLRAANTPSGVSGTVTMNRSGQIAAKRLPYQ